MGANAIELPAGFVLDQPPLVDKRFLDTIYAEVGGGEAEEVRAVASVFLGRANRDGLEKALRGSSAYNKKSREYVKAQTGQLKQFEQDVYDRNKAIIEDLIKNPSVRLPYTHFENVAQFGEPDWAKGARTFKDIGHQRFYVIDNAGGQPEAKRIQQKLVEKGFDPGPIDGVTGPRTREALKDFQKSRKLKIDDVIGSETIKELFSAVNPLSVKEVFAEEITTTPPLPKGFFIDEAFRLNSEPFPEGFVPTKPIPELRQAKPKTFLQKVREKIIDPFGTAADQRIAKSMNVYAISKTTGIPMLQVEKKYDTLIRDPKITGMKPSMSNEEFTALVTLPFIGAGLIAAPVATGLSLLAFTALDKLIDLKKFVPEDASDEFKTIIDMADFIGKGALVGGLSKKAPNVIEQYFKRKITEYKLPQRITLTRDEIASLFGTTETGIKISPEKQEVFKSLNLTREELNRAVRQGLEVEIPSEKIIRLVDKPFFGQVKKFLKTEKLAETFPHDPILKAIGEKIALRSFTTKPKARVSLTGLLPAPKITPPLPEGFQPVPPPSAKPVKSISSDKLLKFKNLTEIKKFYDENIKGIRQDVLGNEIEFRDEHFAHLIKIKGPANFSMKRAFTLPLIEQLIKDPDEIRGAEYFSDKYKDGIVYVREFYLPELKKKILLAAEFTGKKLTPITSFEEPTKKQLENIQKGRLIYRRDAGLPSQPSSEIPARVTEDFEARNLSQQDVRYGGTSKPTKTISQEPPDVKIQELEGKEVWQLTQSEYGQKIKNAMIVQLAADIKSGIADPTAIQALQDIKQMSPEAILGKSDRDFHKSIVKQALLAGQLVPTEVLKDYPELQKSTEAPVGPRKKVPSGSRALPVGGAPTLDEPPPGFEVIEETPKAPPEEFKLFEESKKIVDKYAARIGERYQGKGHLGIFQTGSGTIRVNALNNVSTVIHEVTHFLDDKKGVTKDLLTPIGYKKDGQPIYNPKTLPIRKELTQIYLDLYPDAREEHDLKTRMTEGYAVLVQHYVKNPEVITKTYPNIVREFLTSGGKYYDPIITELIADGRKIIQQYRQLDPLSKIGARVIIDPQLTNKASFLNPVDKIFTEIADHIYPFEKLSSQIGLAWTKNDPSLWLRVFQNSSYPIVNNIQGKNGYWILKNGDFVKVNSQNWRDLVNIIKKKNALDDFGYYLIARDTHFQYQELDKLKLAAEEAAKELEIIRASPALLSHTPKRELDELKEKIEKTHRLNEIMKRNNIPRDVAQKAYFEHRDRFKEEEALFDKLVRYDLDVLADSQVQLVTQKKHRELAEKIGYAPLKRDVYDDILGDEQGPVLPIRVAGTKVSSQIGRVGSELAIINPLYGAIKNHAEVIRKALKQIIYNKIANFYKYYPDLFFKTELVPHKDSKTGVITYPQERDPNIIMAREGYIRVPIVVDKELKTIINEILTIHNVNIIENFLNKISRFFTKGTTGIYIPFAGTNFVIDQITATAQTRNKLLPILEPIKDILKGTLKQNSPEAKYLAEYFILGGDRQTLVGWQDLNPSDLFRKLSGEKTAVEKIGEGIVKAEDILATPARISEIMTRAAEYIKARQAGKPQIVALEEAGRVTAPFHHIGRLGGGRFGQSYVRSIPYFNPSLQVLTQYTMTLKDRRLRKRALFVSAMVAAAMVAGLAYIMKNATQKQKDLYKDIPAEMLGMYIFFPSRDGERLHRLRVPEQMGTVGALINMVLLEMTKATDYTFKDYVGAATQFIPDQFNFTDMPRQIISLIPHLFRPAMEVSLNKRTFPKIAPLEGIGLEAREPAFRFTNNTSAFSRWLGQKLNLSPIKIDHLIEGYMGRSARALTGRKIYNPFLQDYYFTSGRNLLDFYEKKQKNDQEYNSLIHKRREFIAEEKVKIIQDRERIKAIDKVLESYRNIEDKKILSRELSDEDAKTLEERRLKILDLIEQLE